MDSYPQESLQELHGYCLCEVKGYKLGFFKSVCGRSIMDEFKMKGKRRKKKQKLFLKKENVEEVNISDSTTTKIKRMKRTSKRWKVYICVCKVKEQKRRSIILFGFYMDQYQQELFMIPQKSGSMNSSVSFHYSTGHIYIYMYIKQIQSG